MATNAEKLVEAEAAYHSLMLGGAVVEVTDQNGEKVRYDRARKGDLLAYIADLRNLITLEGGGIVSTGPLRMVF
jgi:hypothetical protein